MKPNSIILLGRLLDELYAELKMLPEVRGSTLRAVNTTRTIITRRKPKARRELEKQLLSAKAGV